MIRPWVVFVAMVACGALTSWIWPEHLAVHLPLVFLAFFAFGTWGSVSLRSGLWCRAVWRGRSGRPEVALTYDDGPDPDSTPALLDLLAARGVRATFFCVGDKVRAAPELVRRMRDEGHVLANHSNGHSFWTNLYSTRRMTEEVRAAQGVLEDVSGRRPRFFRPPFGYANHATGGVAAALGLEVVGWDVRSFDTFIADPRRVAERVLARVRPGSVVLLHDGGLSPQRVLPATEAILDGLESRGLRPVGLEELLTGGSSGR